MSWPVEEWPPVKAQPVRVLDVVVIGPAMILGGAKVGGPLGAVLLLTGVGTIAHNARNFQTVARRRSRRRR